jgi:AmmeMemoRadiSam system protein A
MLEESLRQGLREIARRSREGYLREGKVPTFHVTEPELQQHRAAFVTLTKQGPLRRCIGYTDPALPLCQTVASCAVCAAFSDPRFPPLRKEELSQIRMEISILTPLKKIEDTSEIQVGRDGLLIKKGFPRGLLLPQVATECAWDQEPFLRQTCCKACLPADAWKEGAEIYTFSAEIFHE